MKGKCFSACDRGQRNESDFYQTPYSLTRLFLDAYWLGFSLRILEPACGKGAIVKVLNEYGYTCVSYDKEKDFLKEKRRFDVIITNPPYSLAFEFILHGLYLAEKVIMLLPLSYLHGQKRFQEIYNKNYLNAVYIFTRYPLLEKTIRKDGKHKTGMMAYAWYVFQKESITPKIYWLDNNKYVFRKKDEK